MKKVLRVLILVAVIVIAIVVVQAFKETTGIVTDAVDAELAKKPPVDKSIADQFSAWDGSHKKFNKAIKATLNDPDSYKHIETRYTKTDDGLVVMTTFTAKNALGGRVKKTWTAKVDGNGNIIEIIN